MSKYTYKRDDTPDVSGCGFVLFLFLALHGFCMYCLKDVSSTQQIHRARSKRRLFRSWNTHINWHNGHKKGGDWPAYFWKFGEMWLTGAYGVFGCMCDITTGGSLGWRVEKGFWMFLCFRACCWFLKKRVHFGTAFVLGAYHICFQWCYVRFCVTVILV